MKNLKFKSGVTVPILGQGTWNMGEDHSSRDDEIEALRHGIDLGMTLIDTAEMYADGGAEEVVGEAIYDRRKEVYLVSKVLPEHSSRKALVKSCENSLKRLKTDYLDLYLLHWRGSVPLQETIEVFQMLKSDGKILDYGVSNFDVRDMEEALQLPGGDEIVTNQVLYNLSRRGIEHDLLPLCQKHKIPIMAYSPIEQGRLLKHPTVLKIAKSNEVTPAQIALAWVLQQKDIIAIPKSSNLEHLDENYAALSLKLSKDDLQELEKAFPTPKEKIPLELL